MIYNSIVNLLKLTDTLMLLYLTAGDHLVQVLEMYMINVSLSSVCECYFHKSVLAVYIIRYNV